MARKHKPHLVLLDITMPVMNGFEAAALIKHYLPDTKILMVSQWDSEVVKRRAFTADASGYVTKDKASRELISEVRRILHERNA